MEGRRHSYDTDTAGAAQGSRFVPCLKALGFFFCPSDAGLKGPLYHSTIETDPLPIFYLPHQHVVHDLEGLRTDAEAATVGMVHDDQEMNFQAEQSGKESCHPHMDGETLQLKEPAYDKAQGRP